VKSAEEIMNMLDAFDLTGSLRDAGELSGVSHHTVARYVAVRDSGLAVRGVTRPMLIDEFLLKVEEWVERSHGKVRADVAYDKLLALGSTRTPTRHQLITRISRVPGRHLVTDTCGPFTPECGCAHWACPGIGGILPGLHSPP
jgi:hypothetical protein